MLKIKNFTIWFMLGVLTFMPLLLPNRYYTYIFNRGLANGIAAIGLVILFGIGGQISLGHVAFFALAAYCSAILSSALGWPVFLTIIIGVLFASLWGGLLSIPAFKLSGPFLSICTVAFGEVVRLLVVNLESLTNGPYGLYNIHPLAFGSFKLIKDIQWYYLLLGFVLLSVISALRLKKSYLGRALTAIREDETAAELMGVNIRHLKALAFIAAAFYAGIAGALYAHFAGFLSPELITGDQSFNLFTMAIIGGQESVIGSIWSGLGLTLMPELMRFLQEYYMMLFSLIVLFVVLLPWQSIGERLWERLKIIRKGVPSRENHS